MSFKKNSLTRDTCQGFYLPGLLKFTVVNNSNNKDCVFSVKHADIEHEDIWGIEESATIKSSPNQHETFYLNVSNFSASLKHDGDDWIEGHNIWDI